VPIGQINLNAKSLPKESQDRIQVSIWTSVFRSFSTGDQQIILFREADSRFPDAETAIALGISVCLISNVCHEAQYLGTRRFRSGKCGNAGSRARQFLTPSEEMSSIQWITNKQGGYDCAQKVRSKAQGLYFARKQTEPAFSCDSWKRLKIRYTLKLAVRFCNSLEAKRRCAAGMDIFISYANVIEALKVLRSSDQILTMGETRLTMRPDKGTKECISDIECLIEPHFHE
jgi:hypothetical protein